MKLLTTVLMILVSATLYEPEYLSEEIIEYTIEIGEEYNICPELLQAIIERESSGQADAENNGCIGLMQISEKWHTDRMEKLGVTDLADAYSNILVGADYIAELSDEYQDIGLVLMLYNMKHSTAFEMYEQGKISKYASCVLKRSYELERIHDK